MEFFFERLKGIDEMVENGDVTGIIAVIRGHAEDAKAWTTNIADGDGDHAENLQSLYDDLCVIGYASDKLFEMRGK